METAFRKGPREWSESGWRLPRELRKEFRHAADRGLEGNVMFALLQGGQAHVASRLSGHRISERSQGLGQVIA